MASGSRRRRDAMCAPPLPPTARLDVGDVVLAPAGRAHVQVVQHTPGTGHAVGPTVLEVHVLGRRSVATDASLGRDTQPGMRGLGGVSSAVAIEESSQWSHAEIFDALGCFP